jgi:hypothetical protein
MTAHSISLSAVLRTFVVSSALILGIGMAATQTATAEPEEPTLDLDETDRCMANSVGQSTTHDRMDFCCEVAGGRPGRKGPYDFPACYAPPAERAPVDTNPSTKPGVTPLPLAPGGQTLG